MRRSCLFALPTLLPLLALCLVALLSIEASAQGAPAKKTPPAEKDDATKPQPLPEGQQKVLQAVVMEVKGVAQARVAKGEKWKALAVNDTLPPGAIIRTGRKSHVALRIGMNATLLVERQSRVAIPEVVQAGQVLKTRVTMSFGKADVRVDRVGLRNDFEVATPTATLAVRGTAFLITWDAVRGFRAIGVPNNKLRAIEVKYLNGVEAHLSKADAASDSHRLPAIAGFYETYVSPLKGAISTGELGDPTLATKGITEDPRQQTTTKAGLKARGTTQGNNKSDGR